MSTASESPEEREASAALRRPRAWALFGIVALVLLSTAHRFRNEFVWDDLYVIVRGDVIHDPSNVPAIFANHTMFVSEVDLGRGRGFDTYRPMTLLTFVVDSMISGRDPTAYHVTSLLLHIANALMVFALARRVLRVSTCWAFFAAAWFALSPDLAEGHVWINGRSDPLCAFFGLSAVLLWLGGAGPERASPLRSVAVAGLFLLGLLSKEVLLMIAPAIVAWPYRDEEVSFRARLARSAPFVVASLVYLAIRAYVLSGIRAAEGVAHVLAALRVVPILLLDGASELVAPSRVYVRSLIEDYLAAGPIGLALAGVVFVGLFALVVRARRRFPELAFGMLWFACTLGPAALIAAQLWPGFGRYLYLPAIGFVLGATAVMERGVARALQGGRLSSRFFAWAAATYLLLLGARLAAFTSDFRDEERLYTAIIEAAPDRAHGYGWLGMTYVEHGRYEEAIPLLFAADRRGPWDGRYLANLGTALLAIGDVDRALDMAATGIGRYPRNGRFHELAARSLAGIDPERAASHLRACLEAEPDNPECVARRAAFMNDPVLGARYTELLR